MTEDLQFSLSRVGSCTPDEKDHTTCSGHAWKSAEKARFIAIAEGAERYAGCDVLGEKRIWATAGDLAGDCLEPARYPRCSDTEYADPACPVSRFDPAAPIRWAQGLDLMTNRLIWVPAVMACYGVQPEVPAENFTYRISTGFAVHTDPVEATVRGICEVVERDAIALLWLQQLALPTIDPALHTEPTAQLIEWCERRFVKVHLFDATTDLNIPTVYCVIAADHDARACRGAGAGTDRDLARAADKALREAVSVPDLIYIKGGDIPESLDQMTSIGDTTRYMALAEHSRAFDFLTEGAGSRRSPGVPSLPEDSYEALVWLVSALDAAGMRPVAVDRTPQELSDVGLTGVSVVIPDLQPMSLNPLAQFKGHPRLYEAPARMGYPVRTEEELNPWPQPFA